jgi:hypothetical protein
MRANLARLSLILVLLVGEALGLFLYNRVLSLFAEFFGIDWPSLILLFVVSVLLIVSGLRILIRELLDTTEFAQINLIKISKFLMGGFIGCYVAFSLISVVWLAIFILAQKYIL